MSGTKISEIEGRLPQNGNIVKLSISNGLIEEINVSQKSSSVEKNLYIAPGLIDNQVNGYMGVDFSDSDLTAEKIKKVTRILWKTGVTTYLPTLITNNPNQLRKNFSVLKDALKDKLIAKSIPGFHLEGPYLSPEDGYRGAHEKRWIHAPDWEEFLSFYKASENKILQVTLAPESEGAIEFIKQLKNLGIVVALGHHNASAEVIEKAVDAGAKIATHLGNGCANMIHRHHNPLWPQLASDRLMASLIADGHHLTPEEVKTFYKAKGGENLVLISDMTKLAGLTPGEYTWNEKKVILTNEGHIKYPEQDVLAGSSAILRKGIENMIRFTGCSLHSAIRMATENTARLNSLDDRGILETGMRADLILFLYENEEVHIKKTILAGEVVYEAGY